MTKALSDRALLKQWCSGWFGMVFGVVDRWRGAILESETADEKS
jgi:hypothetical protein